MGQLMAYTEARKSKGGVHMRGYFTASGYYGLMNGRYVLFASESEYFEAAEESES